MNKKILMVSGPYHTIPPLKGAAVETWMYEVSKRLSGFEPHIVSIADPSYPIQEFLNGVHFHRIHFSCLYKRLFQKLTKLDPLSYQKRIARIVDDVRPDIVHIHNMIHLAAPLIKLLDKRIKTVLHLHNIARGIPSVEVDLMAGCSNFIVNAYSNTPIKAKQCMCVYNGVDLKKFRPYWEVPALRERIRNQFGIRSDEHVVLYVGRLSSEKGVEHFVDTAFRLKNVPSVRFIVIGEIRRGRADNDRVIYGKKILEIARPLKDKIVFTDVYPPSEMHLMYLLGDVVVVPSNISEAFSMVAIEAMATGLPVITRKKGGLLEYLADGSNGFFVGEDNIAEDIADILQRLMVDSETKKNIGMEGRKTVEQRFSWEEIARTTEKLYDLV